MQNTYSSLNQKFTALFAQYRPKIATDLPTFQAIAGYPNYENFFSNIYQFFLEQAHHGLEDLFLTALDDCLEEEDILMNDYEVFREYPTNHGGRIDLVILEKTADNKPTKVVMIENKIHHSLNNDLVDYWDTFKAVQHKVGIVLTEG